MRGISPIISTILMVAIAIAAAVVVYYITMDVMTKQGAQLQEQAEGLSTGAIVIQGVSLDANNQNTIKSGDLNIYYDILNTEERDIAKFGGVMVYVYDEKQALLCSIDESNLNLSQAGIISLSNDVTCSKSVNEGNYYYVRVAANKVGASQLYKVKAT